MDFPGGTSGKEPACQCGDRGSIPGLGRSPGGGHDITLQYSCLENPMDREAWRAAVYRVARSWTWLNRLSTQACTQEDQKWQRGTSLVVQWLRIQLPMQGMQVLSIPDWGNKIPHAMGQLSPCNATRKPLHSTRKTPHSQFFFFKWQSGCAAYSLFAAPSSHTIPAPPSLPALFHAPGTGP